MTAPERRWISLAAAYNGDAPLRLLPRPPSADDLPALDLAAYVPDAVLCALRGIALDAAVFRAALDHVNAHAPEAPNAHTLARSVAARWHTEHRP